MSDKRVCIKCSEQMTRRSVAGIEVDTCDGCGGLWLDKGEIWQLSQQSEQAIAALNAQLEMAGTHGPGGTPYREFEVLNPPGASPIDTPCPGCQGKLASARLGPVLVEHCTECEGLYLDRGELDKAIELMKDRGSALTTIASLARSMSTSGAIDSGS